MAVEEVVAPTGSSLLFYQRHKPLAVFGIPYGYVKQNKAANGFYHVGDQLAVIPSFSGDGMAIALHSAARAAVSILSNNTNYHATVRHQLLPQIRIASLVSSITANRIGQRAAFAVCNTRGGNGIIALRGSKILGSGTLSMRTSLLPCQQSAFMTLSILSMTLTSG